MTGSYESIWNRYSWPWQGVVTDVVGTIIEAHCPQPPLGSLVALAIPGRKLLGEVVGFRGEKTLILPLGALSGLAPGMEVHSQKQPSLRVGPFLLGHILDGLGSFLDEPPSHSASSGTFVNLDPKPPEPLSRQRIDKPLPLGVRTIDGLLTFCEGQRLGIMAGSGVGKSVLLGMIARGSRADVNVIGLIGERGREVRDFLERDLREEGRKKSVVVVVTSDQAPVLKLRGVKIATAIAEAFAQEGKKVLLMVDSLSRVAQAQREIGLAVGEPPTTKGYPPSVFSLMPQILERCGPTDRGSISGLYTVLVDGDDFHDPVPDTIRGILDGHICLSRDLASEGHYPAIDVPASLSRLMLDVVPKEHAQWAQTLRNQLSCYDQNKDYVHMGAYQPGSHPELDKALKMRPELVAFLKQSPDTYIPMEKTLEAMKALARNASCAV